MNVPVKTCTCCGRSYDAASWGALPFVGRMDLDVDGDGRLVLRNCPAPCLSTLIVDEIAAVVLPRPARLPFVAEATFADDAAPTTVRQPARRAA